MKQELDDMQKTHCLCADKEKETEFLAGGQLEPVLNSLSCCSLCMGAAAGVVSSLPEHPGVWWFAGAKGDGQMLARCDSVQLC